MFASAMRRYATAPVDVARHDAEHRLDRADDASDTGTDEFAAPGAMSAISVTVPLLCR